MIELASGTSIWRGMDYYESEKVTDWTEISPTIYEGHVQGSASEPYTVRIETDHPRRSVCNCAFASGRRVICKHMIALYFTAVPQAVQDFEDMVKQWEKEQEEQQQKHLAELRAYVRSLSKKELQERLYNALLEIEDLSQRRW